MAFIALAALKFFLYCLVCTQAPRLLGVQPKDNAAFSMSWAAARMAMGLAVGYPAFLLVMSIQGSGVPFEVAYAAVLLAARILLWLATSQAIAMRHKVVLPSKLWRWVALGVLASFAIDGVALLAGNDNFKFFC